MNVVFYENENKTDDEDNKIYRHVYSDIYETSELTRRLTARSTLPEPNDQYSRD